MYRLSFISLAWNGIRKAKNLDMTPADSAAVGSRHPLLPRKNGPLVLRSNRARFAEMGVRLVEGATMHMLCTLHPASPVLLG